jgi:hypothetical protein
MKFIEWYTMNVLGTLHLELEEEKRISAYMENYYKQFAKKKLS